MATFKKISESYVHFDGLLFSTNNNHRLQCNVVDSFVMLYFRRRLHSAFLTSCTCTFQRHKLYCTQFFLGKSKSSEQSHTEALYCNNNNLLI